MSAKGQCYQILDHKDELLIVDKGIIGDEADDGRDREEKIYNISDAQSWAGWKVAEMDGDGDGKKDEERKKYEDGLCGFLNLASLLQMDLVGPNYGRRDTEKHRNMSSGMRQVDDKEED